jgi:bacillithiol biosynthesis cysteine-adding enzyme BshC
MMARSMKPHCLPLAEIPHTSALFRDWLTRFSRVKQFYAHDPFARTSYAAVARAVRLDPERRRAAADALAAQNQRFGAGRDTLENIERLRDARTVAVVTGQQVGLFGGPAYSAYKAMSAIRLAARLARAGIRAVPVFWLASEDHDFAEVNHCWFLDADQRLMEVRDASQPPAGTPVGRIVFSAAIEEPRRRAESLWSAGAREANELLGGYAAGRTYTEAFARLLLRLFAGRGLVLLDPLDPTLHAPAMPLLRRALEEADALDAAVRARNRELERAGYEAQVKQRQNATLLFRIEGGRREPIRRRNHGQFIVGESERSLAELVRELESAPERFSPNVLLRPVLQDWLLPTAAYVAGPHEVAYFAQASALYDQFDVRMPVIVPRASLTLVEPKAARLLAKYGLGLPELFHGEERLRERLADKHLPRGLVKRLVTTQKKLEALLAGTKRELGRLDRTLAGAAETSRKKMLYQLEKLRRKAERAQAERNEIIARHAATLMPALYPGGGLQERRVSFLSFAARHGEALVQRLLDEASVPSRDHHVIFL